MAVGDKQKLITEIVGTVLNEHPQTNKQFEWFINKHTKEHFGKNFNVIDKIFKTLNRNINANQNKRRTLLKCDAYFGGKYSDRTEQRAYLDCFRDLLLQYQELNPTLRINEFEVSDIYINNKVACNRIEQLLKYKLKYKLVKV